MVDQTWSPGLKLLPRLVNYGNTTDVVPLSNGNYVVMSPSFGGSVGAATFGGNAGVTGTISATNSLVGSTPGDHVSGGGVQALPNGNYVVMSPQDRRRRR